MAGVRSSRHVAAQVLTYVLLQAGTYMSRHVDLSLLHMVSFQNAKLNHLVVNYSTSMIRKL